MKSDEGTHEVQITLTDTDGGMTDNFWNVEISYVEVSDFDAPQFQSEIEVMNDFIFSWTTTEEEEEVQI